MAKKNIEIKREIKISPKNKLISEDEIARDFAEKAHRRFDRLIKSSILFGSQAKNTAEANSDIDIIFIIDDAGISWDLELIAWYREELGKLIQEQRYKRELHINTIKLTTFWHDLIKGDPVVVNILRYGIPLIDSGAFFEPIKSLLLQGKIHATTEAAYAALQRVPEHLARSHASELAAIEGVYWAMIDASQAALISLGKLPPSPEHIPEMLNENLVKTGFLSSNYINSIQDIYKIHKEISHGQRHDIKGAEIDKWQDLAEKYVLEISKIIEKIIDYKK